MNIFSIFLVAISLTFDTFAVSVSTSISNKDITISDSLKFAFILSVFQGLMPVIGWQIGEEVSKIIAGYDKYIAFILLAGIGVKMIFEAFKKKTESTKIPKLKLPLIIFLAIATSIDALVVGFSFAFIEKVNITQSAIIIGLATFMVAMFGLITGKKAGNFIGDKGQIIGGIVLIALGIKFLII